MKKIKIISLILVLVIGTIVLTGCTESNRVSHNEINYLPEMIVPITITSHD